MRAVLERDFLHEASRPRAVVLRTLVAALVTLVLAVAVAILREDPSVTGDELGALLFTCGGTALACLAALVTPPLVVGSVLEERRQGTLPLLLASPVGPEGFARAKLLSRWGVALLLLLAALPCLAFATLYGGVSGAHVFRFAVLLAALTLELAAWGLWVSTVSRRAGTAVVMAYLLPGFRWWLVSILAAEGPPTVGGALLGALAPVLPLADLLGAVAGGRGAGLPALPFPGAEGIYAATAFLLAVAATFVAGRRLRREAEPEGRGAGRTLSRWNPLGRVRGRSPGANPVLWKEMRLLDAAVSRVLYYGVLGILLLGLLLSLDEFRHERGVMSTVTWMTCLVSLVAAITGAVSFGNERSGGGYDLLRASPLTAEAILRGKMAGVLAGLLLLVLAPAAVGLCAGPFLFDGAGAAVACFAAATLYPAAWGVAGMACGLLSATTRRAVVRAALLYAGALIGLPLAALVTYLLGFRGDEAGYLVIGSPPLALYGFLEAAGAWSREGFRVFGGDHEVAASAWILGTLLLAAFTLFLLPGVLARRMARDREEG